MVLNMAQWMGKVAVVTGASAGIGAAIVNKLVEKGLIVVGIARRVELIEQRAKACTSSKGKLHAVKADISKEEEVVKAFDWIEKNVGPIHILINNAGVATRGGITQTSFEDMKKILDLNVLALCVASKEAINRMKKNKINGHIIHINSTFGMQVFTHELNIYPASKFAVTAVAESLRQELSALGIKIKVTCVNPGLVATEMTTLDKNITEEGKAFFANRPILQTEDIVDGVVYALSTPEHVQIREVTITPL